MRTVSPVFALAIRRARKTFSRCAPRGGYLDACTSRCTSTTIVSFHLRAGHFAGEYGALAALGNPGALSSLVHYAFPCFSSCAERVFSLAPDPFRFAEPLQALPLCPVRKLARSRKIISVRSLLLAPAIRPRPLRVFFQFAAASLKPSRAGNELRGNRQLVRRQSQASLAVASSTPAISNMMRPGFTTETHFSRAPLALPMLRIRPAFW